MLSVKLPSSQLFSISQDYSLAGYETSEIMDLQASVLAELRVFEGPSFSYQMEVSLQMATCEGIY